MADTAYQIVGFHFRVRFPLRGAQSADGVDVRFQSVSGLECEMDTEPWKEGGENGFEHTLPGRRKFTSPLVLKRGLLTPGASALTDWCNAAFVDLQLAPLKTVSVELLDEKHNPLVKWDLQWVWPKSWKIGELNAERSEVLIETLELNFNRLAFKNP